jgi:hypothetical protein
MFAMSLGARLALASLLCLGVAGLTFWALV